MLALAHPDWLYHHLTVTGDADLVTHGATVQPFLDVRTAVLNGTLEDAFRRRYPGFRPANDDQALPKAA